MTAWSQLLSGQVGCEESGRLVDHRWIDGAASRPDFRKRLRALEPDAAVRLGRRDHRPLTVDEAEDRHDRRPWLNAKAYQHRRDRRHLPGQPVCELEQSRFPT